MTGELGDAGPLSQGSTTATHQSRRMAELGLEFNQNARQFVEDLAGKKP